jgi:hypothetical protein
MSQLSSGILALSIMQKFNLSWLGELTSAPAWNVYGQTVYISKWLDFDIMTVYGIGVSQKMT